MKKWILTLVLLITPSLSFTKVVFNGLSYDFSFQLPKVNDVILLFSFDNYKKQYHMAKDPYVEGLYKLNLDIPKVGASIKPGKYYYRIIADGIMTYDPDNTDVDILPTVGKVSYFIIENQYLDNLSGPTRIDPLVYRFFYHRTGRQTMPSEVLLTGDFNSWNLYGYLLKQTEEDPNVWYVDVTFDRPGRKEYMFIVDGKWIADINNSNVVRNAVGQNVSILQAK